MHKISLDVEEIVEREVFVDEETVEEGRSNENFSLMGKLLSRKPFNLEAMRVVFIKARQISQDLEITEVGERAMVFLQQPWSFNRALLVLVYYNGIKNIDESLFDRCPFWVQLPRVLASLHMKKGWLHVGKEDW